MLLFFNLLVGFYKFDVYNFVKDIVVVYELKDFMQFGTQGLGKLISMVAHENNKLSQPIAEFHANLQVILPLVKLTNVVKHKVQHFLTCLRNFKSVLVFLLEFRSRRSLQFPLNVDQPKNFNFEFFLFFLGQVIEIWLDFVHALAMTLVHKLDKDALV
mgnify:CR=1 FL=1